MLIRILVCLVLLQIAATDKLSKISVGDSNLVESNHFRSDSDTKTTHKIDKLKTQLAMVVVLRPQEPSDTFGDAIKITLVSGSDEVECKFISYQSLCVLENLRQPQAEMNIQCQKLPCQLYWNIYQQPTSTKLHGTIAPLYQVQQTHTHTILAIKCNNPQYKDIENDITLHSETQFTKVSNKGIIFYLFQKQQKGHLFFYYTQRMKSCASIQYQVASKNIPTKNPTKDFIRKQKSIFSLPPTITSGFRLDCSMHGVNNQTIMALMLELTGVKDGKRTTIYSTAIQPIAKQSQAYDFSYSVHKLDSKWSQVQFQFNTDGQQMVMLSIQLSIGNLQSVSRGESAYFFLPKDQSMEFQLQKQPSQDKQSKTYMILLDESNGKIDKPQCSRVEGCKFTVTSMADNYYGCIFISSDSRSNFNGVLSIFDMGKSVSKKISQGDKLYFQKTIPPHKSTKILVNSPNVIIFIANAQKCKQPDISCNEAVGNSHKALVYQNENEKEVKLIIGVQGLDNSHFTLSVTIEHNQYVELAPSIAFSYPMSDKQSELVFKFSIKKKTSVSFNLISPLHSLVMLVSNSKHKPKGDEQDYKTIDGYIYIPQEDIKEMVFTIVVAKTAQYQNKYLHFSIIATTSEGNMQLQPGVAHYETFSKGQAKQFVFEFDTQKDYMVNFYTHNIVGHTNHLKLQVSNQNVHWNGDKVKIFDIDSSTDHLNLKDVSKELCQKEGQTACQIFLKITNNLGKQVDLTITLMLADSILQLKDGLWQSYVVNQISSTTHFYFFPRHQNNSIAILYKSTYSDLRIAYTLFKAEDQNIDPTNWPYPQSSIDFAKDQNQNLKFRPIKHINIGKSSLQQCWPSCVVLISLIKDSSKSTIDQLKFENAELANKFSILVSNSLLQIPQKSKIDVVLQFGQQKYFLIDLKRVIQKNSTLTIFTSSTFGSPTFRGTVYSQNNPRCPTDGDSDIDIGRIETQLLAKTIIQKLNQNKMYNDQNIYLCLLSESFTETKFYLEWTSDQQFIKLLDLDSFETVVLDKGKKLYQFLPRMEEYQLKVIRTRGFPFIQILKCDYNKDGYESCLSQMHKDQKHKKQMVSKVQLFSQAPCQNCIIFIQISSLQPTQLSLHLQSQYSQIEIQQNQIMSDFIEKDQINRYFITYLSDQQTIISLHVFQGQPQIEITDSHLINIKKTKESKNDLIHITIPPTTKQKNYQELGVAHFSSNALLDNIKTLHVSVKSLKPNAGTSYTITYSSGDRQTYLQDGLLTGYLLQAKKDNTFYYQNTQQKSKAVLSVTMPHSDSLKILKMKMYYYTDPHDLDTKVQFTPEKPPMRTKTPNPTILFSLPSNHRLFSFHFTSDISDKITLSINHLQVVLLPNGFQFPFVLNPNQSLNFLFDIISKGYLQINIRKCDNSEPSFAYSFNEQDFNKGQYQHQSTLNQDPHFQYNIRANQIGTFFMNFKSFSQPSILAIKATLNENKQKYQKLIPGNKGIIDYQLLSTQQASITFTNAVCQSGICNNDITFYTISGVDLQSLYSQTVCPSTYFSTQSIQSVTPLQVTKIEAKPEANQKITFSYKLPDHISYLSVKGILKNGEQIYYKPIEIVTLWGQLSRTSQSHKLSLSLGVLAGILVLVVCVRMNARKGYKRLQQQD